MRDFVETWGPFFAVLSLAALLLFAVIYPTYRFGKEAKAMTQICLMNGYASYVDISGLNYCYRITGNRGELILVDTLSQETGR